MNFHVPAMPELAKPGTVCAMSEASQDETLPLLLVSAAICCTAGSGQPVAASAVWGGGSGGRAGGGDEHVGHGPRRRSRRVVDCAGNRTARDGVKAQIEEVC